MKIIIAGAGDVGTHLAKMLSREDYTVILLDENAEKIKALEANYDILAVPGDPTSIQAQREAQVPDSDLFVAVTPYESTNITACLLATNLGTKKTLARVSNQEYLLPKNREFFKSMGVDSLINPESLAATEIVNGLKKGWVRQYLELSGGALIVLATKIRQESPLCGIPLREAFSANDIVRVVAIKRADSTIIPGGNDSVLNGDVVYFITTLEGVDEVRKRSGKEKSEIDSVMMMGGGRITVNTIRHLPAGMNIKVLEQDMDKIYRIIEQVGGDTLVIHGDGRDVSLLKEEEIGSYDAFVALTGNSEANILGCLTAKGLGVRRTIAEVENMDYIAMAENLDIGAIINKKIIAASHIYQMILGGNASVRCLTFVDVDVVEMVAEAESPITKAALKEMKLPPNIIIGGVVRGGKGFVAVGDTRIQTGDSVTVFCTRSAFPKIERWFK